MKKLLFISLLFLIGFGGFGQLTFHKTYGGSGGDMCNSMDKTISGYILVGSTHSFGGGRAYLMEIDTVGGIIWSKTYGEGNEAGTGVTATTDGRYVLVGSIDSTGNGLQDIYVIKTDSIGDTLWTRRYGEVDEDYGVSIQQSLDGGFIVAGSTKSYGQGENDVYLMKIDSNGNLQWTKTFGGSSYDYPNAIQLTNDSGYIIVGTTFSYGAGSGDIYLIKTDGAGNVLWTKTYGSSVNDEGNYVQPTNDNGFIITGYANPISELNPVLIKTDSVGDVEWSKRYNTGENTTGTSVIQTADGGFLLSGGSGFYLPYDNTYLIKTNSNGDTVWTKLYPGATPFAGQSILSSNDGGYIVARWAMQAITGQESVISVLKIDSIGNVAGCDFYPANITVSNLNLTVGTGGIAGTGGIMNNTATTIGNAPFVVKDTCFVLGIVEPNSNNLKDVIITVYPNPTKGKFTVQGATAEIQIFDLFGRLVLRTNKPQIDMSSYPAGLYVWRVGEARGKLVLE